MTAAALTPEKTSPPLPRLRADLQFELLPEADGGFPSVIVADPVRGSYFRLAWPESGILLLWQEAATTEDLSRRLHATYGVSANAGDIAAVAEFAFTNQLTALDAKGTWHRYAQMRTADQHGWFKSLMHSYLFFRWPLVHPEPGLHWLLPRLSFLFRRTFWIVLAAIAIVALYLATRQWTALESAARDALRLECLAVYGVALLVLKGIHELGHALTTVYYGCRVPSMGIAVMLGAPVLYTDTTDSWRLGKRSERLAIVFAGVAAEMVVATFALLTWSFLPEGIGRDLCFAFATTSIAMSLAINLNPFMRFDGYFALSDYLRIPNLQSRAFNLALWKLREFLFDLGYPPPESFPLRMQWKLIVYAVLTAIYRLVLYLGIVVIVYLVAGKAIGIILAIFEIAVFIANPIVHEIKVWWKLRAEIAARNRSWGTVAACAVAVIVAFVPWISTVQVPAVLVAEQEQAIYLPFAAQLTVINVANGQDVTAGDILFIAESRDLANQHTKALLQLQALKFQAARLHASEEAREVALEVESKLARAGKAVTTLEQQQQQLVIRAPFSGKIVDLDSDISAGLWLDRKQPLARLVSNRQARVRGLVSDAEVERVKSGARATFIADDAAAEMQSAVVVSIAHSSDGRLTEPALADVHGGGVAVSEQRGESMTRAGWFEVILTTQQPAPSQLTRGVVQIEARAVSPVMLAWHQVARVLVREQGF